MKEVLHRTRQSVTRIVRDEHDESGQYYFHQIVYDDHILERNKRIRLEDLMVPGQRLPALGQGEDAEAAYAFSVPQEHFARLQRDYPDIYAGLINRDVNENFKAAKRLQKLHPEWSVMAGRR